MEETRLVLLAKHRERSGNAWAWSCAVNPEVLLLPKQQNVLLWLLPLGAVASWGPEGYTHTHEEEN